MDEAERKKIIDELVTKEEVRKKMRDYIRNGPADRQIRKPYKPKTEFLKQRIAKAHFGSVRDRRYIEELCEIEDTTYRRQVLHEGPGFYGSYSFLHPEQFGPHRDEYFAMLKEMSQPDYIRVLANEMSDPQMYGGWKNGKQIPPPSGVSGEDKKAVLERKERLDTERAKEWRIADARQEAAEKKNNERDRKWWVENSGKI